VGLVGLVGLSIALLDDALDARLPHLWTFALFPGPEFTESPSGLRAEF